MLVLALVLMLIPGLFALDISASILPLMPMLPMFILMYTVYAFLAGENQALCRLSAVKRCVVPHLYALS